MVCDYSWHAHRENANTNWALWCSYVCVCVFACMHRPVKRRTKKFSRRSAKKTETERASVHSKQSSVRKRQARKRDQYVNCWNCHLFISLVFQTAKKNFDSAFAKHSSHELSWRISSVNVHTKQQIDRTLWASRIQSKPMKVKIKSKLTWFSMVAKQNKPIDASKNAFIWRCESACQALMEWARASVTHCIHSIS